QGLLILTNDGELANRLMHPSYEVPKTYVATVRGRVPRGLGRVRRAGVDLDDGRVQTDRCRVEEAVAGASIVEIVLHEGRNRIVRRLLAEVGHPVTALVRTAFGPITLGSLKSGRTRVIAGPELGSLMRSVSM